MRTLKGLIMSMPIRQGGDSRPYYDYKTSPSPRLTPLENQMLGSPGNAQWLAMCPVYGLPVWF